MAMFIRIMIPLVELLSREDQNLVPSVLSWIQAKKIRMDRVVKMRATQLTQEKILRNLQSDYSRWRLCQIMSLGFVTYQIQSLFPKKQADLDSLRTVVFISTDSNDRIAYPMNIRLELWYPKLMNQSIDASFYLEYYQKLPISILVLFYLLTP